MKHRAWFTLVLRALGVWLMASNAGTLFWTAGTTIEHIYHSLPVSSGTTFGELMIELISGLGSIATFAIGAYLFFSGRWVINRCLHEAEAAEDASAA